MPAVTPLAHHDIVALLRKHIAQGLADNPEPTTNTRISLRENWTSLQEAVDSSPLSLNLRNDLLTLLLKEVHLNNESEPEKTAKASAIIEEITQAWPIPTIQDFRATSLATPEPLMSNWSRFLVACVEYYEQERKSQNWSVSFKCLDKILKEQQDTNSIATTLHNTIKAISKAQDLQEELTPKWNNPRPDPATVLTISWLKNKLQQYRQNEASLWAAQQLATLRHREMQVQLQALPRPVLPTLETLQFTGNSDLLTVTADSLSQQIELKLHQTNPFVAELFLEADALRNSGVLTQEVVGNLRQSSEAQKQRFVTDLQNKLSNQIQKIQASYKILNKQYANQNYQTFLERLASVLSTAVPTEADLAWAKDAQSRFAEYHRNALQDQTQMRQLRHALQKCKLTDNTNKQLALIESRITQTLELTQALESSATIEANLPPSIANDDAEEMIDKSAKSMMREVFRNVNQGLNQLNLGEKMISLLTARQANADKLMGKLKQMMGEGFQLNAQQIKYLRKKLSTDYASEEQAYQDKHDALQSLLVKAAIPTTELGREVFWDQLRDIVGQHTTGSWGNTSGASLFAPTTANRSDLAAADKTLCTYGHALTKKQYDYLHRSLSTVYQKSSREYLKQQVIRQAVQRFSQKQTEDPEQMKLCIEQLLAAVGFNRTEGRTKPTTGLGLFANLQEALKDWQSFSSSPTQWSPSYQLQQSSSSTKTPKTRPLSVRFTPSATPENQGAHGSSVVINRKRGQV